MKQTVNYLGCLNFDPLDRNRTALLLSKLNGEHVKTIDDKAEWNDAIDSICNLFNKKGLSVNKTNRLFYYNDKFVDIVLCIKGDVEYQDVDVAKFIDVIAPYVYQGEIEYMGKDSTSWRYVFRAGKWCKESQFPAIEIPGLLKSRFSRPVF